MKIDQTTVAVVTGAASGIGRALAIRLAREGVSLAIADLLINNAGVGLIGTAEELSIEDIEWLMGVNFWGVVYGVKYFLPVLRQQPRAHIVNISSVFGIIGPVGHSAYAASKFAVRGFSETLRHELAGGNIKVSVVHPGGIKTNIANDAKPGAGAGKAAVERARAIFNAAARTSPEAAAERIVRGVLRDEERILIGADAWMIDRVQRWAPVKYWRFLGKMIEMMAK